MFFQDIFLYLFINNKSWKKFWFTYNKITGFTQKTKIMLYEIKDIKFVIKNYDIIATSIFKDYPDIIKIFKEKSGNEFLLKFLEKINQVLTELWPLNEDKENFIINNIKSEYKTWQKITQNNERLKNNANTTNQKDQDEADNLLQNI